MSYKTSMAESTLKYRKWKKHLWTINYFSEYAQLIPFGECMKSNFKYPTERSDTSWDLKLYPNGVESNKDSIILRLFRSKPVVDSAFQPLFCDEIFEVRVRKLDKKQKSKVEKRYMKSRVQYSDWVLFPQLSDSQTIPNDSITIKCEVRQVTRDIAFKIKDSKKITESINDSPILSDLFNNQRYCDFNLCVGDKIIGVHKGILAARCSVFDRMFENDMAEKKENKVDITDIDYDVLHALVSFIYTGNCPNLDIIADRMIIAAEKYGLEDLKNKREKSLRGTISVENSTELLVVADLNRAERLKSYAISFIQSHASQVMETGIML